jgi:hypothetical protein
MCNPILIMLLVLGLAGSLRMRRLAHPRAQRQQPRVLCLPPRCAAERPSNLMDPLLVSPGIQGMLAARWRLRSNNTSLFSSISARSGAHPVSN